MTVTKSEQLEFDLKHSTIDLLCGIERFQELVRRAGFSRVVDYVRGAGKRNKFSPATRLIAERTLGECWRHGRARLSAKGARR